MSGLEFSIGVSLICLALLTRGMRKWHLVQARVNPHPNAAHIRQMARMFSRDETIQQISAVVEGLLGDSPRLLILKMSDGRIGIGRYSDQMEPQDAEFGDTVEHLLRRLLAEQFPETTKACTELKWN